MPYSAKGHIVAEEDIPVLLSVGKEQLYIWDNDETMLHENEAAEILCSICLNDNMKRSRVKEGKIELTAECSGLFKIRRDKLKAINSLGQMMIASRHGDTAVRAGDKLLGTRIIPLVTPWFHGKQRRPPERTHFLPPPLYAEKSRHCHYRKRSVQGTHRRYLYSCYYTEAQRL